jgi:hypothetical protein
MSAKNGARLWGAELSYAIRAVSLAHQHPFGVVPGHITIASIINFEKAKNQHG